MTDLPDEAVEAAARVLRTETALTAPIFINASDGEDLARAALTAAAPLIAAQAATDLRAGIEALRDEWRANISKPTCEDSCCRPWRETSDALDVLLREGE